MKTLLTFMLCTMTPVGWATTALAGYTETMNPNSPVRNLGTDYGLVDDNATSNQSGVFQKAIDDLAAIGGGRLIVPKGTYRVSGVRLKSN